MLWTNIRYYGQLPFVNLSRRAQIIYALRILTLIVSLVLGSYLIGTKSRDMPLYTLESRHIDLAKGLYDALKTTSDNSRSFMTTSEILLLANYIENHIKNTPEQVRSGINDWCAVTYSNDNVDYDGVSYLEEEENGIIEEFSNSNENNVTIVCYPNHGQPLDYVQQLSDIGLDITLSYAYNNISSKDQAPVSSDRGFVTSIPYKKTMTKVELAVHHYKAMVISTIVLQSIMIFMSFGYYSMRGNDMDDQNISWIFKNIFAVFSLANMTVTYASYVTIYLQLANLQDGVLNQLTKFGIHLKYGTKFQIISAFWETFSVFVLTLWAGPVWCNRHIRKSNKVINNQIPLPLEAYEYDYNYVDDGTSSSGNDEHGDPFSDKTTRKFAADHYDYDESRNSALGSRADQNKRGEQYKSEEDEESDPALEKGANNTVEFTRYLSMPSSQNEHQILSNPFNPNSHENRHVSHDSSSSNRPLNSNVYGNSSFVRSEPLFSKRKPPTTDPFLSTPFNSTELIPMTPIMGPAGQHFDGQSPAPPS